MSLEKWKRNDVFKAIRRRGLRPEEFHWEQSGDDDRLIHPASSSHFVFAGVPGRYNVSYVAGDGAETTLEKYIWEAVMESVTLWLHDVKTDVETPDLWADLHRQRQILGADPAESVENTPFTPAEQAEIAKQLREIKVYVTRTYSLSEADLRALENRLAYLDEAAQRLGRLDWRNAFLGALMGYLIAAALPPDTARALFEIFIRTLGQLFGHDFPRLLSV